MRDADKTIVSIAAPGGPEPNLPGPTRAFAVGTGRLEVIRGALARGDYEVDLALLAERLLSDELG